MAAIGRKMESWWRPGKAPDVGACAPAQAGVGTGAATDATGEDGSAARVPRQGRKTLHESPTMRRRLYQLFVDKEAVLHPPALQYGKASWSENAADICNDWIKYQSQQTQRAGKSAAVPSASSDSQAWLRHVESACEISRMLALAYELKHRKKLQQDHPERMLLPGAKRTGQEYNDEIVKAFLRAVGEDDIDDVLDTFKNTGTGALHRHDSYLLAAFTNLLGALQLLILDPASKAIVSAFRFGAHVATTAAVAGSGERRLRNAGTEDVLPLGRADAAKSARSAPNLLQASWSVLRELRRVKKDLEELGGALAALNALQSGDAVATPEAVNDARNDLSLVLARLCHKVMVKARYKAAKENVAVEFRGNERNLYAGSAGTLLTVAASGVAIMTPEIIVSAVTGGFLAGAATTSLLLYLGYQLSNGPSKDGEAKARRAIIALAKLTEALDPAHDDSIRLRAEAYEEYRKACKQQSGIKPTGRNQAARSPKQALFDRLNEIATAEGRLRQGSEAKDKTRGIDGGSERLTARQNWDAYCAHHAQELQIENGEDSDNDKHAAVQSAKLQYYASHAGKLAIEPMVKGWSAQIEIKITTTRRLLAGKVARAHKHVLREQEPVSNGILETTQRMFAGNVARARRHVRGESAPVSNGVPQESELRRRQRLGQAGIELKRALRDLAYFELACSKMKVDDNGHDISAPMSDIAKAAFARIDDSDVHALFQGDAAEQVRATLLAKKLTEGEDKRYTLLNLGANAITMGVGAAVQAADLQIVAAKANGTYQGPRVLDFKLVTALAMNATPAAPLSTGDRTAFQKREMQPLLKTIAPRRGAMATMPGMQLPSDSLFPENVARRPAADRAGESSTAGNIAAGVSRRGADWSITEEPLAGAYAETSCAQQDAAQDLSSVSNKLDEFDKILDEQADTLVESMSRMEFVPDGLRLIFDARSEEQGSVPANTESLPAIDINLKETSAFHRVRYKKATPLQKSRYILGEAAIAARQAGLIFLGPPAQGVAQRSLKKTRGDLESAGDRIAQARRVLIDSAPSDERREPAQLGIDAPPQLPAVNVELELETFNEIIMRFGADADGRRLESS